MIHKGVPVDEEVWLTRDGVAKGEDDVVKKGLDWITTTIYGHDVLVDRSPARPGIDSIRITATLSNPLQHPVILTALVADPSGVIHDSLSLFNDGRHGEGLPGDSNWGIRVCAPSQKASTPSISSRVTVPLARFAIFQLRRSSPLPGP